MATFKGRLHKKKLQSDQEPVQMIFTSPICFSAYECIWSIFEQFTNQIGLVLSRSTEHKNARACNPR